MNKHALKDAESIAKSSMYHLLALGILKGVAGLVTGMTVIIADALSSFADILGLFASYIGLHMSRRSEDKKFEYGYHKVETFAALVIAVGILYIGSVVLFRSISSVLHPVIGEFRGFAMTTTVIAIVYSYRLSKKLDVAGKNSNSLSLLVNAKDKKMDVFAGFAVLISIVANYNEIPYVEGIVSIVISLIILKEGVYSTKESLFFLLDYWDNPTLYNHIKKVLRLDRKIVLSIKKLRLRRAGTFIFGETFLEINPFTSIESLREEIAIIQKKIVELDPYIKEFSIYTNIGIPKRIKIAVPIKEGRSLKAKTAQTMNQTKAYLFAKITKGQLSGFYIKQISESDKKPDKLIEFLNKEKIKVLIDNQLSSLAYFNLKKTHNILIYPNFPEFKTVEDSIKILLLDTVK